MDRSLTLSQLETYATNYPSIFEHKTSKSVIRPCVTTTLEKLSVVAVQCSFVLRHAGWSMQCLFSTTGKSELLGCVSIAGLLPAAEVTPYGGQNGVCIRANLHNVVQVDWSACPCTRAGGFMTNIRPKRSHEGLMYICSMETSSSPCLTPACPHFAD